MPSPRRQTPLGLSDLDRLALGYVGRYATTQKKLRDYLRRKIAERGWAESEPPPVDAIVERCAAAGYVDDDAFAESRAAALTRRGFGTRRIGVSLAAAGIDRALVARLGHDEATARAAAEAFARRRRIGRFARAPEDEAGRRRAFAAMLRAGHDFALAREFVSSPQETDPDRDSDAVDR